MRDYEKILSDLRLKSLLVQSGMADPLYLDAADAIEELLAAVQKWNPASKPPKEKGDYWCNVRSHNFDDTYYQHEVWFDGECFVIDGICTDRVTHWMPLPSAPKED